MIKLSFPFYFRYDYGELLLADPANLSLGGVDEPAGWLGVEVVLVVLECDEGILLRSAIYSILIFFFSCEATLDNTQNVPPSLPNSLPNSLYHYRNCMLTVQLET